MALTARELLTMSVLERISTKCFLVVVEMLIKWFICRSNMFCWRHQVVLLLSLSSVLLPSMIRIFDKTQGTHYYILLRIKYFF